MRAHRLLAVPAAVVLGVALAACGDSADKKADATSSSASASVSSSAPVSTPTSTTESTTTVTSTATTTATTTETPIGGDVVAPVTMNVNQLQGATVSLVVGQVLNIDTGSLPLDSYQGEVANTSVASYINGYSNGGAQFSPGVTAVAPGTTAVTMTNSQGGIQPLTFTVVVTPR